MRSLLGSALLAFLALTVGHAAQSSVVAGSAADTKRPNILWLIAEDFSPDLGCYGTKEVWSRQSRPARRPGHALQPDVHHRPPCAARRARRS